MDNLWSLGDLHETLGVREPSSSTVVEGRSFQILQSPLPGSRIDDTNAAKPFHHRVSFAERSPSDSLHPSKSSIMLKRQVVTIADVDRQRSSPPG